MRVYMQFRPVLFGIERAHAKRLFLYYRCSAKRVRGNNFVDELRYFVQCRDKNIRIAQLQPSYVAGLIYHNESDPNTAQMEAQLGAFNMEIQGVDDIIDTSAYQEQYTMGRSFDEWE